MRERWIFKYQPKTFEEMVLESSTRKDLEKILKDKPNFMLFSRPGMGKGTFVNIFIDSVVGRENTLWLNGSDENSIDVMRTKVKDFARSLGMGGLLKYVVINEADRLSPASQDMLREEVERVDKICGFCFMINEKQRIVEAHFSRFVNVDFNNPPATEIFDFCMKILKYERINVSSSSTKKNLISLIKKSYPDLRRIVNSLQFNVRDGKLVSSVVGTENLNKTMLKMMLEKDVDGLRKTLKSNYVDYVEFYTFLYENVGEFSSPGDAIILIAEHLYRDDKVAVKEINFMHMYFSMMKCGAI